MKKKYLLLFIRLVVSFGLIGYFLYVLAQDHEGLGNALKKFASAFSGASLEWLIPAFLLHLVGFSLVSLRWKILLKAQGVDTSYRQLFAYYFMAAFFNAFLPSTIGGDTVRAIESKKLTGNTTTSVMVVIIERLTGLMALVLIAAAGLFVKISRGTASQKMVWVFLAAVLAALLTGIVLIHPKVAPKVLGLLNRLLPAKIYSFVDQAYAAVAVYYQRPAALLSALAVSIVFQFNMVVYYFLLATALNQDPDPIDFMMKVPIMIFLLMTVPAINGLGIRTAGFKGLMEFPATYALAMECIDVVFRVGYGLLGGLCFLFYRRRQ